MYEGVKRCSVVSGCVCSYTITTTITTATVTNTYHPTQSLHTLLLTIANTVIHRIHDALYRVVLRVRQEVLACVDVDFYTHGGESMLECGSSGGSVGGSISCCLLWFGRWCSLNTSIRSLSRCAYLRLVCGAYALRSVYVMLTSASNVSVGSIMYRVQQCR